MANWYKIPPTFRITDAEYSANIRGLNIVFGAVLGFVLAGTENLALFDFVTVLFLSAVVVIQILYLGSSEYRLFHLVITVLLIAFLPMFLDRATDIDRIPYLQPTLAVWTAMVVMVEILPRQKDKPNQEEDETP